LSLNLGRSGALQRQFVFVSPKRLKIVGSQRKTTGLNSHASGILRDWIC
jgi:hypothetical protein